MKKEFVEDELVEAEIERLTNSPAVKLARKEQRLKYKRKQYLYQLRCYEKRGKELMDLGIDSDNIEARLLPDMNEDNYEC